MTTYEYHQQIFPQGDGLPDMLNKLGREGWECFQATPMTIEQQQIIPRPGQRQNLIGVMLCLFKREIRLTEATPPRRFVPSEDTEEALST